MPNDPPDWELLREYAKTRSDAAFAELVRRYIDFVYSTALRRTHRDTHLAEDITQAVFVILARKAGTIRAGVVLSGWLHRAARYVAANALRREYRHNRRRQSLCDSMPRQEPVAMPDQTHATDDWEAVAPLLDTALDRLRQRDRDAVLLRFMQGMSHREIGQAIGITEEAARKRIERAVSRLRDFFVAKGVSVPAAALTAVLAANTTDAAPPALSSAAVSASSGGAPLADGALRLMVLAKAKLVAFATAAALLVSTSVVVVVIQVTRSERPTAQAPAKAPTLPAKPVLGQPPPANTAPIEGIVYGVDGEPLPGAEVYLATTSIPYRGFAPEPSKNPAHVTQNDGRFSFPDPKGDAFIVVRHLGGYAQASATELARSKQVFVKAWARVEGALLDGDTPLPNQRVFFGVIGLANDPQANSIIHQTAVQTAQDGTFVAERVPASQIVVCREQPNWGFQNKWERVDLSPGATAKVRLGGVGRHVVGRLLPPESIVPGLTRPMPWDDAPLAISTAITVRRTDLRPDDPGYFRVTHPDTCPVGPDGTFRIQDLRPGSYSLSAATYQNDRPTQHAERIAGAATSFIVPPMPDGRQRVPEPLDIGVIRTEPFDRLLVGAAAPDFEARSLDGKPIKLADYRGKHLLAWFRYTSKTDRPGLGSGRNGQIAWYGAGGLRDADWLGLKKAHQAYANDPDIAMLAIEVEDPQHTETIADAAKRHGASFPLATIEAGDNKLNPAYTFSWGLVLIDPEGKVAAKNFSPANAQQTVAKALLEGR